MTIVRSYLSSEVAANAFAEGLRFANDSSLTVLAVVPAKDVLGEDPTGSDGYVVIFDDSDAEPIETLDDADITTYVVLGGQTCPYCGSDDLDYGTTEMDTSCCSQGGTCDTCGRQWSDDYTMTGLTPFS